MTKYKHNQFQIQHNKNISNVIRSWPTSCSTLTLYNRCCQHNRQRVLSTSCDSCTLLTTLIGGRTNIWTYYSTFDSWISSPRYPSVASGGGCKCSNRISGANFYVVFHSNYGSILLSFWDMTIKGKLKRKQSLRYYNNNTAQHSLVFDEIIESEQN